MSCCGSNKDILQDSPEVVEDEELTLSDLFVQGVKVVVLGDAATGMCYIISSIQY